MIRRMHRMERVHCKHGCIRSYVKQCDSLEHLEHTCDLNPNAASIGGGIYQQDYNSTGQADHDIAWWQFQNVSYVLKF